LGRSVYKYRDRFKNNNYLGANSLFLNFEKSAIILHTLSERSLPNLTNIKIHDDNCQNTGLCNCKSVNVLKNFKYLGLEMCHDMKWKNQISLVCSKLKKAIFIIKQLRDILPKKDMKSLYLSLIESQITYGIIGWGGAYNNVLTKLQTCQNALIRTILKKDYRYPTETMFKEFNVLNIKNLYYKISIIFIKKHKLLQPLNHNVNTRYAQTKYIQTWPKKTACRKSLILLEFVYITHYLAF
jgi:hypothetical protein